MRRRVLATITVAATLLLGFELVLAVLGDRIGQPQYWYSPRAQDAAAQIERLAEAGYDSDLVLAGSSMVEFGFRPELIEEAMPGFARVSNVGIPKGYTTVMERWLLEVVVPPLSPDRIVWGLSSLDFNDGRPVPALPQYEEARAGTRGIFGAIDRFMWSISRISRYRDLLRGPAALLDLLGEAPPEEPERPLEDLLAPVEWPNVSQSDAAFRALRNSLLLDYRIGPEHAEAFERTVTQLQASGIEVVLALMPVSQPYVDAHPNGEADYEEFVAWISDQAGRLGLPLFDYGRAVPEDRFLDYNHIDEIAATALTEMLVADLAGLGW